MGTSGLSDVEIAAECSCDKADVTMLGRVVRVEKEKVQLVGAVPSCSVNAGKRLHAVLPG